jgi:hypothetical protein
MRYEVEPVYRYLPRRTAIIEADSASEAGKKAEAWARNGCATGDGEERRRRFETFEPGEL